METEQPNRNNPENGMKILARMIAEAYLEELSQKPIKQESLEKKEVEECRSKD